MEIDKDKTMRAMFEWTAWLRFAAGLGQLWTLIVIPGLTISTIRATVDITALLANLESIIEPYFGTTAPLYHAVKTHGTENRSQTLQKKFSCTGSWWLCWQTCQMPGPLMRECQRYTPYCGLRNR